ncbi:hypothetical protein VHEMI09225 [[Torrubiella] hemipterigena]|uniref:Uncharacterized protein n=1 Tax=[Torrubiella] hemipterigena TaxID=1531966 RepID=A0A0A1TFV4_9HYPO|nr:hypothetical protein VHEMI09225 [[Torrubiella] hemipterigena]
MPSESQLRTLSTTLLNACKQGSLATVRSTAPILYPSATPPTSSAVMPLSYALATAARHGRADVLKYMLTSLPACSTSRRPWSPLMDPSVSIDKAWEDARYSDLVIMRAVQSSSTGVVQALLDAGMHVDQEIDKVGTPLSLAIATQNVEMVRFLLGRGANANGMEWLPPVTFLARAASFKSQQILLSLLDHGAKVHGSSALYNAAEYGHIDNVELLLARGADLDELAMIDYGLKSRHNAGTALHAAVENGQTEIVQILLKRGAKTDIKDAEGKTARDLALETECADIVRAFDEAAQQS